VEFAVVAGIIALLAGVLSPVVNSQIEDVKQSRAIGDMDVLAKAFTTFHTHTSVWPYPNVTPLAVAAATGFDDLIDFRCLYANAQELPGWRGPYLNMSVDVEGTRRVARAPTRSSGGEGLLDPWGQPYRIYRVAPAGTSLGMIAVLCRGPDGAVNSSANDVIAGVTSGDDLIRVISRRP
jgi:hypothetical protein